MRNAATNPKLKSSLYPAPAPCAQPAGRESHSVPVATQALDEAFATLNESLLRVDEADAPESAHRGTDRAVTGHDETLRQQDALVSNLVAQLESLDRQRRDLSSLLDSIDKENEACQAIPTK